MDVRKLIGKRIRQLRLARNMTQEKLAENVSIDPKYQSRIENGKTFLSSSLIEKYAVFFNLSIEELLHFPCDYSRENTLQRIKNDLDFLSDKDLKIILHVIKIIKKEV